MRFPPVISDPASRLLSALAQLAPSGPPRLLDVGCGLCECWPALQRARPGWQLIGLDVDWAALRTARRADPARRVICADARTLPGLLRATFGVVLVRHPDLFQHAALWRRVIPQLPALLAPGGVLLITVYAPEDLERLAALALPPALRLNERALAPVDVVGRDRYVRAYRVDRAG